MRTPYTENPLERIKIADNQMRHLLAQKQVDIEKALKSGNPQQLMQAQQYYSDFANNKSSLRGGKSMLIDPFESNSSLGYFDKNSNTSFATLRMMGRAPIIRAIVNTRKDQIADFAHPQTDKYSNGFVIKKKSSGLADDSKSQELTDTEKKEIEALVEFLLNGGDEENKWHADSFESFIRKIAEDSLTLDQYCFEMVRNRRKDIVEYYSVDAATIRFSDTVDDKNDGNSEVQVIDGYMPSYVQIWQNRIFAEWYPWEMCVGIRNPQTNIRTNGYGRGELEDLIQTVTSMLNADSYNSNFFQNGSNPKGMLMIKKASGINPDMLAQFKSEWQQTMAGVDNFHKTPALDAEHVEWLDLHKCLSRDSKVISKNKGLVSLENLLKNENEIKEELWDGKKFSKARIFVTIPKEVCEVELYNRLKIKTSPEHRFLCLKDNGTVWVQQKDLKVGDYVFINKKTEETTFLPKFNGHVIEDDLMELLGWILGDGWVGDGSPSKKTIKTFYHPEKELDIRKSHKKVCEKYGINFRENNQKRTIGEVKNGFVTNYSEYPIGVISDYIFYKWYRDLGFSSSREKKVVPEKFFNIPSHLKCSFLRGFFSADGHISKNGHHISICISNKNLHQQTIDILLSEGIRSCKTKALKSSFLIQDKDLFLDKINFIQQYKQDRSFVRSRNANGKDFYPKSFVKHIARNVKEYNKKEGYLLNKKDLKDLLNISNEHNKATVTKVLRYGDKINFPRPNFIDDYYLSPIISLMKSDEVEEMVDVEMFNDSHAFCANGIIVHNSNKDMEFSKYQEYLIKIGCAIYKISPEEVGFPTDSGNKLGGGGNREKEINYSKEKGLRPILRNIQRHINKYLIEPKSDNKYEFTFVGLDTETEAEEEERLIKAVGGAYMEVGEARAKKGLKHKPEYDTLSQMIGQGDPNSDAFMEDYDNKVDSQNNENEKNGSQEYNSSNGEDTAEKGEKSNPMWNNAEDWWSQNMSND